MLIDEDIRLACEAMKRGGVVLYPTDTVWGIGCDATRSDAVRRVFEIKRRADNKALIVMLGDARMLDMYVDDVPEIAYELIDVAVKPLTIVYDRGRNLAPELLGEDGSVGIRVTGEYFSRRLCRAYRRPIVSTSANISGEPTPAIFSKISVEIKKQMDYIVVCYGTNDIARQREEEAIKKDLLSIVLKLKKAGIKVLLQTLPQFNWNGENLKKWININHYIKNILVQYVDIVFDVAPLLTEGTEWSGVAKYNGHPNEEGCRIWANALTPVLRDFLEEC